MIREGEGAKLAAEEVFVTLTTLLMNDQIEWPAHLGSVLDLCDSKESRLAHLAALGLPPNVSRDSALTSWDCLIALKRIGALKKLDQIAAGYFKLWRDEEDAETRAKWRRHMERSEAVRQQLIKECKK